ncbi:MAG TPA: hypothetical protein VFX89_05740 [Gammaproteobacteria bacterium]|nr:hypothetical protein [Gammaproteobacteria bacterium]
MGNFIKCSLGSLGFAAILSGPVLAQPAEEPEEIIVRAKPLKRQRLEIELARDEMIRIFNEANEGEDNDVRCRYDAPTGSRIPQRVCFSASQDRASARLAGELLQAGTRTTGSGSSGTAALGALPNMVADENRATVAFDREWQRVMATNQQFRDAVVKYNELENVFDRSRGATIRVRIPTPSLGPKGRQCDASTYTEYDQRGSVARVTGTVSLSACPGGTMGRFTVVATVRNEAGAVTPIEFSEAWQTDDTEDYVFYADYPIGDNVSLENVRVRSLRCTCTDPPQ